MAIENREGLKAGTKLEARYQGKVYHATVQANGRDGMVVTVDELKGQEFKSLSTAGKEVMGGIACNGWRFWSLAGTLKERANGKAKTEKPKAAAKAKAAPKAKGSTKPASKRAKKAAKKTASKPKTASTPKEEQPTAETA